MTRDISSDKLPRPPAIAPTRTTYDPQSRPESSLSPLTGDRPVFTCTAARARGLAVVRAPRTGALCVHDDARRAVAYWLAVG